MIERIKSKYRIINSIGSGGMAEIFLAISKETGKKVAIKVLHSEKAQDQAIKKRFKNEIQLCLKVNSPYVVKILDFEFNEEVQYIVMEHINGEILRDRIKRLGRLTVDEAVEYTKQLSLGLAAIHKAGIIHRDIKSANIMIAEHESVKIVDFGISLSSSSERLTKTNNIIGSVRYIAPEIILQKKETHKVDIYSLGILLFEMLTGTVPYKGKTPFETAQKHVKEKLPDVKLLCTNAPQALINVITRATAKDPNKRYPNMYMFYKDISDCLSQRRFAEKKLVIDEKKSFIEAINSRWTIILIAVIFFVTLLVLVVIFAKGVA